MKVGLLVIRENGLMYKFDIWERINVIPSLHLAGIVNLKWNEYEREARVSRIYSHISNSWILKDIEKIQGTKMIALVIKDSKPDPFNHVCSKCGKRTGAERLDNMNINRIKDDIRVQFGNVLHSADTEQNALAELEKFGVNKSIVNTILAMEQNNCLVVDCETNSSFVTKLNVYE